MTNNEIKAAMKKLPYYTKGLVGNVLYDKFTELRNAVNDKVTGIWFLTKWKFEDTNAPQIVVRSSVPVNTLDRTLIHSEIFDFISQDMNYDFDAELMNANSPLRNRLIDELKNNRVLTIYDSERE